MSLPVSLLLVAVLLFTSPSPAEVREVVHIAGLSAVGKKTLIRRFQDPAEAAVRRRFGIADDFVAYGYSFRAPAEELLRGDAGQLVHQWQFVTHELIDAALAAFPRARHRIVLLWRPPAVNCEAVLSRKGDWRPTPDEMAWQWRALIGPRFSPYVGRSDISLEIVDGTAPDFRPRPQGLGD